MVENSAASHSGSSRRAGLAKTIGRLLLVFATLAAIVAIIRDTAYNGWDLNVFRAAGKAALEGSSPYRIVDSGKIWPFKYPPWTVPLFVPFGLGSAAVVKWTWGALQAAMVVYAVHHLIRRGLSRGLVIFTAFAYWWIWAYHALAGQISLVLLTAALVLGPAPESREDAPPRDPSWRESLRLTVLFTAFSVRIFSVFPLLAEWRRYLRPKPVLLIAAFTLAASLPALMLTADHSPLTLIREWLGSAANTDEVLQSDVMRGRRNQSLTCAALRLFGVSGTNTAADAMGFLVLGSLAALLWFRYSRHLPRNEQWYGWLGLSLVVHPLSWVHSFVLAFPVSAAALHRARASGRLSRVALGVLAIAMTCWISRSSLGAVGHALELISIRSWGVVLSCWILATAGKRP